MRIIDRLILGIIEYKIRKLQRKFSKKDRNYVKKQIEKLNPKTIDLDRKWSLITGLLSASKTSPYYSKTLPPLIKDLTFKNAFSILKKLPFTTSEEISRNSEHFLAIPKSEIVNVHFTYGTTGGKKTIYNSKRDMNIINYSYTLGFINCGISKSDVAQILYSFGVWGLAENIQRACLNEGILALSTGNYLSFKEQQNFIEKFDTSILFGTPSYIYNLAREINLSEKSKRRMKAILVGGEGLPEHRRKIIEERLGGKVFINYGLNEIGGGIGSECKFHSGYHVFPSVIHEIIDPKTGEPVEKGEYGELVLTAARREAMPLVRYRTGDITREIESECDCGLVLPRIDYLIGRADDRIVVGTAEKYYPIDFDLLFDPIEEIKDYWIEIITEDEKDSLKIFILTSNPSEDLRKKILKILYSLDSIRIDIETTKTLNIPEITFVERLPIGAKRRRLVDKRKCLS